MRVTQSKLKNKKQTPKKSWIRLWSVYHRRKPTDRITIPTSRDFLAHYNYILTISDAQEFKRKHNFKGLAKR